MQIKNIDGLTLEDITRELQNGGRFVVYQYTISVIFMTFKNGSDIHFLRAGQSHWGQSLPYTLLTFALGWWGIPWGPIYTIGSLYQNLSGGKDVTAEVMQAVRQSLPA